MTHLKREREREIAMGSFAKKYSEISNISANDQRSGSQNHFLDMIFFLFLNLVSKEIILKHDMDNEWNKQFQIPRGWGVELLTNLYKFSN